MSTETRIEAMPVKTQAPTAVEQKLADAWGRERRYFHLRGLASLAPWLVGLFLFDLLLDWWLDLPGLARPLLLLVNLAILGWLGYRYWLKYLRRFDSTRVALQVERLHPGLNNLLISYVQLNGSARMPPHGSPRLIEAMCRQAVNALVPLDFLGIVNFRNLRGLLALTGGVLLLFVASSLIFGEYYRILVVRMLNPFTEVAYPTRTRIEGISNDVAVKEGDPVDVEARAAGEVPEQGTLYVKFGDASWEEMVLTHGEEPVFTYHVGKATQSFVYYFKIGDVRSKRRQVTVVHPPRIVKAEVELLFPKYTGRTVEEHQTLQLPSLPERTEVRWKLRCDQPLAAAQFLLLREDAQPREIEIDPSDPHVARLAIPDVTALLPPSPGVARKSSEPVSYRFRWKEQQHGFEFLDSARYTLDVIPDQAPIVTVLKPRVGQEQDRILITTRKLLDVVFEASDDHGLDRAWIAFRVNDDRKGGSQIVGKFPPGTRSDTFKADWKVQQSLANIREGDLITCEIVASDNREGNANFGRSRSFRLQVVSEEEYQRFVDRQTASGLERTKTAAREEIESSKRVKTLIPQ
jgi:hypothetical protein